MKAAITSLAFLASAGSVFAVPSAERGDQFEDVEKLEKEIEELAKHRPHGGWGKAGGWWGGAGSWGSKDSSSSASATYASSSSSVSVSAVTGTASGTGYFNSSTVQPYWSNSTASYPYGGGYGGSSTSEGSGEVSTTVAPYGEQATSASVLTAHITLTETVSEYPSTIIPVPYGSYTPSGYESSAIGAETSSMGSSPGGWSSEPGWGGHGGHGHGHGHGHGGKPTATKTVVTVVPTSYTTPCPYETTYTSGGSTLTSSGITTSTVETSTTLTLTLTEYESSSTPAGAASGSTSSSTAGAVSESSVPGAGSPSGYNGGKPSGSPTTKTVVTVVPTTFISTCPYEITHTTGGSTVTSSGLTTSTITTSTTLTLTLMESASSSSPAGAASGSSAPGGGRPSGYQSGKPSGGLTSTITKDVTTTYTSRCTEESTKTSGSVTSISTYYTTSTITSTYQTTITVTESSSTPAGPASGPSSSGASSKPSPPVYGGSSSSSGLSSSAPSLPVYGGSSSSTPAGPISASTSTASSGPAPPVYGGSTSSSSPASPISASTSTTSDTSYTTFLSTCYTNGSTELHTHSQPITVSSGLPTGYGNSSVPAYPTSYGSSSSPVGPISTGSSAAGYPTSSYSGSVSASATISSPYGGGNGSSSTLPTSSGSGSVSSTSSSVSGPISGTSSSTPETSYTTFETTCTENGTTVLHTHSQPITTTGYNSTVTSPSVGPTGTGSVSSTISGPVSYSGNSSSTVGPTGSGSLSSSISGTISISANLTSSTSETSFTTYTTTCSENGTAVVHTHSAPIKTTSSSPVGPIKTGSTGVPSNSANATSYSTSSVSGTISISANSSSSTSETSFTTYTTTCSENGTAVIHTHSAPITTGSSSVSSGIPSNSANLTSSYPTAPVTTSASSSSSSSSISSSNTTSSASVSSSSNSNASSTSWSSTSSASSTATCVPCKGQPGSNPGAGPGGYCGYTINDNPYEVLPNTCVTREYDFVITNTTLSPDGVEREVLIVNGQMPGPLIEANWGDTIVVKVTNQMQNNGSTIHWHGQRQNYTNEMDGVSSITQCPIAPGESMTYTFRASNFGVSWWHAHYSLQLWEGVFGPMVVHGPKSVDEEFTEEVIVLQDWSHVPVDEMYDAAQTEGPRTLDTGLINGMNVWGGADGAPGTTGERWSMSVTAGQTYLLRIINTGIQSTFVFSIDSHSLKVIAADYVPIVPYDTNSIYINNGQRYDVLVTFDQTPDNYWMRSDNQDACATVTEAFNIKAIIQYDSVTKATPTTTSQTYTAGCNDEPLASLTPYYGLNAGVVAADGTIAETVTIGENAARLFKWSLNGETFTSEWDSPTLLSISENGTVPDYSGKLAIEAPNLGEWIYVIIQSPIPFPHPIHLHGHDFYILAQGVGTYSSAVTLNLKSPPRRDVALMPWNPPAQGGYLVIAFYTDNPGVWLMHCHIGWHSSMGFALQIIENLDGIKVENPALLESTCSSYRSYANEYSIVTDDSGI